MGVSADYQNSVFSSSYPISPKIIIRKIMHIYVVWGFLGSGKTTLINYLLSSCFADKKVVIVENESGAKSVDGLLLKNKNYQVRDITSGCICCTLRMELPRVIREIELSVQPDIILIEPSGLASLEDLTQMPNFKADGIISLVDVCMYPFLKKQNLDFYRRQFRLSSVVLLTKTEQVDDSNNQSIVNELLSIQPQLKIISDYHSLCSEEWERIWSDSRNYGLSGYLPVYSKVVGPKYETWTILAGSPLNSCFCESLFNRVNKLYPEGVVRAKGLVLDSAKQWGKMDYVNNRVTIEALSETVDESNEGFISVWWNKSETRFPIERISTFINATEITCPVEDLLIDDNELYRYLGYGASSPNEYMFDFVQRLKQEALLICVPRFGYRLVPEEHKDKYSLTIGGATFNPEAIILKCLQNSEFYAAIVASVGQELDEWIEVKRAGEDVMEAFIADALGSVIVEAVIAWGLSFLACEMKMWGLKVSNSYSPGYCGWDVAEQRVFFSMFPDHFCGISLTESCLMLPVKSVSALVGIGEQVEKKPYGCAICRKKDCFKRKEVKSVEVL